MNVVPILREGPCPQQYFLVPAVVVLGRTVAPVPAEIPVAATGRSAAVVPIAAVALVVAAAAVEIGGAAAAPWRLPSFAFGAVVAALAGP